MNFRDYLIENSEKENKKLFINYAVEIIENYIKFYPEIKKDLAPIVRHLQILTRDRMLNMALPETNKNYQMFKKYFPKNYNKFLFDNGNDNLYKSAYMSLTNAKQLTIIRKAIEIIAKKYNLKYDKNDLIK